MQSNDVPLLIISQNRWYSHVGSMIEHLYILALIITLKILLEEMNRRNST